jgi:hypothetical protein
MSFPGPRRNRWFCIVHVAAEHVKPARNTTKSQLMRWNYLPLGNHRNTGSQIASKKRLSRDDARKLGHPPFVPVIMDYH